MIKYNKQRNTVSGFTIIEAMIAIFILSISVVSMLGVTATSASYSRYANNEITATYLLQEAVDSIRNSRDTIAFQLKSDQVNYGWNNFLKRYGYIVSTSTKSKCFSASGCDLKIENFDANDTAGSDICTSNTTGCYALNYHAAGGSKLYYNHTVQSGDSNSIFTRNVKMYFIDANQVKVVATVSWQNVAGVSNTKTQTLETYLLNWQK